MSAPLKAEANVKTDRMIPGTLKSGPKKAPKNQGPIKKAGRVPTNPINIVIKMGFKAALNISFLCSTKYTIKVDWKRCRGTRRGARVNVTAIMIPPNVVVAVDPPKILTAGEKPVIKIAVAPEASIATNARRINSLEGTSAYVTKARFADFEVMKTMAQLNAPLTVTKRKKGNPHCVVHAHSVNMRRIPESKATSPA